MSSLTYEIRDRIAWVTFDQGSMNTLSRQAIAEVAELRAELAGVHAATPLDGVILKGNRYGLGAGANISELMNGTRAELESLIDQGNETMFAIQEGDVPWVAVIDGYALGGIYELALSCHGIVATSRATVGFPEIKLNIFPGLGGTQRMPRRSGLLNAADPAGTDAGFTAILQGKNFKAAAAARINMVDTVVPDGADVDEFAATFLRETLPGIDRTPPADLRDAESLRELILPLVRKATQGRPNPRAPYVAVDVMIRGAQLPLREAIAVERDAFVELATGSEAKAGMRFFFTQQSVQKPPPSLNAKPRELRRIGIDGIDGYMGNAIAWLALEAGYEVVGHAPLAKFAAAAPERLRAKYARAIKRGRRTESQVDERVASVNIVAEDPTCLADCDLVVEARMENRELKAEFFGALGACIKKDALVASNSSSMGPGMLGSDFRAGGGDARNFVNLHFFSPAEHPSMQLVEIIRGADTTDEAVVTAHSFVRKIGKTPVILADGSPGFLVNAGLAAYFAAAEELYREGTAIETIDAAVREAVLPMGPFELADQAGLDICAGMYDTIAADGPLDTEPLVWKMRALDRFGVKSGEGYYAYDGAAKIGEWSGLAALVPGRGSRVADSEEIVRRCTRALYDTARQLCETGIVASEEEADLAFVFGIGFAMHLGGPIYYGKLQGWDH